MNKLKKSVWAKYMGGPHGQNSGWAMAHTAHPVPAPMNSSVFGFAVHHTLRRVSGGVKISLTSYSAKLYYVSNNIIYKSGIQVLPPGHFQVRGIYNQGIRPGAPWCSVATAHRIR